MKRVACAVLILLCLCGCKNDTGQMDGFISFRDALNKAEKCEFTCKIVADYIAYTYSFGVKCTTFQDGKMEFTILEPDTIASITGSISEEKAGLIFDDQIIAFEPLSQGQLSPAIAPWLFMKALKSGYLSSAGQDGKRVTVSDTYRQEAFQVNIWFNETYTPSGCEIFWDGTRILSLQIEEFIIS